MNDLSTDNGQDGLNAFDAFFRDRKIVVTEHSQVCQLSGRYGSLLSALA